MSIDDERYPSLGNNEIFVDEYLGPRTRTQDLKIRSQKIVP